MNSQSSRLFNFEIEGKFYGRAYRKGFPKWGGQVWFCNSLAYFCPSCGRVWARIGEVETGDSTQTRKSRWQAVTTPCSRCGGNGSIYHGYDEDCLDTFPRACLERELEIALADPDWPEAKLFL